jgi:hypothetical protein
MQTCRCAMSFAQHRKQACASGAQPCLHNPPCRHGLEKHCMRCCSARAQVAIIRSAGLPQQAEWLAELGTIVDATKDAGSLSPCVMIVGKVVSLASEES